MENSTTEYLRLNELSSFDILDSLPEKEYDEITLLASSICNTPISLITFIDDQRQWIKARTGIDLKETKKEDSFCQYTIQNDDLLIIENAENDPLIGNNKFVLENHVRFYAGAPLITSEGNRLGALCVIDMKPHAIGEQQKEALKILASKIILLLELRRKTSQLEQEKKILQEINEGLDKFAYSLSHDLKAPVNNLITIADLINKEAEKIQSANITSLSILMQERANNVKGMIKGVLDFARKKNLDKLIEKVSVNALILEIKEILPEGKDFKFNLPPGFPVVETERVPLMQVFQNLIVNAIKYHHLGKGIIDIGMTTKDKFYTFSVKDDGPGIPKEKQKTIFEAFERASAQNQDSYGIGLSTVKDIIRQKGGELWIDSEPSEGTTFSFTWPI